MVTQATGLRERNKQDKRRRIHRAALELFRERGYQATTTRAIAERAKVATGTLFLYAKSKEDVLLQAFAAEGERIREERFATLPDAPIVDRLVHVFDGLFQYYAADPALGRILVREILFIEPSHDVGPARQAFLWLERVAGLVAEAQRRGEIGAAEMPLLVASNAWAIYLSTVVAFLNGALPYASLHWFFRASLELLLRGAGPHTEANS